MTAPDAHSLFLDFVSADQLWGAALDALFGKRAHEVRYTNEGRGEPGSSLRALHDAREAAREAWEQAAYGMVPA